jgi:acid phosphatase (class A)
VANPKIHPCLPLERSYSYPSGHAVAGIVWATLLSEIFPEKRDALMARGKQIGDDRVLAGVHYPTDVIAGRKLGEEIARRLLADQAFRAELEKAKQECLAAAQHH